MVRLLKLFGKGYGYETLIVGSTLNGWQTVFSRFNFAQVRYGLGKVKTRDVNQM